LLTATVDEDARRLVLAIEGVQPAAPAPFRPITTANPIAPPERFWDVTLSEPQNRATPQFVSRSIR
jgi:hypothetical protein